MKIIVAGCGKVGKTIVEQLNDEGHDISIIDTDANLVETLTNSFDVLGVVGSGASYEIQQEAGVKDADLLIAATDSDEINMLCCLIAKKAGGCRTIARVRNPLYRQEVQYIKEELGLSMVVNPEMAAAGEISRIIRCPSAINIETFARGRIELTEFIVPGDSPIVGMRVMDIRRKLHSEVLICAVERNEEVFIPHGNFVIEADDVVNFIASPSDVKEFFKVIGIKIHKINTVLIAGGGMIAYYLTRGLFPTGVSVKIIEQNRERCEKLAELLPEATVIHGDATSQDLLLEEGIRECGAFVSLTGIDETNIFLSLEARNLNKDCKLITKANKLAFEDIIMKMNLGSMIYPKYMTAERIIRYVRAMQNAMGSNIETLYRIIRNKVEAIEFIVRADTPVKDIPLIDMHLKENLLIAAISRKGEIIYPNGQTELKVGDRVIVVTTNIGLKDLKDILAE